MRTLKHEGNFERGLLKRRIQIDLGAEKDLDKRTPGWGRGKGPTE